LAHGILTTPAKADPIKTLPSRKCSGLPVNLGNLWIVSGDVQYGDTSLAYHHQLDDHYLGSLIGGSVTKPVAANSDFASSLAQKQMRNFGRWGTSQGLSAGGGPRGDESDITHVLHHGPWTHIGWNGSAWEVFLANGHLADLDFDQSENGPYIHDVSGFGPGAGSRRAMEVAVDLESGLTLAFTQNGSVAQSSEYVVDEHTTVPCWVGWGKDNISDAEYEHHYYLAPTVYREGDEPVTSVKNMWTRTSDDPTQMGIDGGYKNQATPTTVAPVWRRGVAAPAVYGANGIGSYYDDWVGTSLEDVNVETDANFHVAMRLSPELELADDFSVTAGSDTFTSAGANFAGDATDVGKTIVIEDSVGNNGEYVVTAFISTTQCTVDRNFTATENSGAARRWKLFNTPEVGFVELVYEYDNQDTGPKILDLDHILYNSQDRGETWTQRKQCLSTAGASENELVSNYEDAGVIISTWSSAGINYGRRFLFDLSDLDFEERRRRYWKFYRGYGSQTGYLRFASMILRDPNFNIICATENRHSDADDPLWVAHRSKQMLVLFDDETADNLQATGTGSHTDSLTKLAGSFYEDNGVDGDTTAGANKFSAASANFKPEDVGKVLRIPAGVPSGGGDYYNFVTITAVDSSTQVTIDNDLNDTTGLTWALLTFGHDDLVYFDVDHVIPIEHVTARQLRPKILDVPTSTTITLQQEVVPLAAPFTTGTTFQIMRRFTANTANYDFVDSRPGRSGYNPETTITAYGDARKGCHFYSDPVELVQLQSDVSSCTTAADSDGDGRVEVIKIVGADWTTGLNAVTAGDVIVVSNATHGRRYHEVKSVVLNVSDTDITVTMDDLPPSVSDFTVSAWRRTWYKARIIESVVIGDEQIV